MAPVTPEKVEPPVVKTPKKKSESKKEVTSSLTKRASKEDVVMKPVQVESTEESKVVEP